MKKLEKIYASGRVQAIGVSNYSVNQIEQVIQTGTIVPAVNQVKFSPFSYKKELLTYCLSKNIVLEAYSPLTRGKKLNDTLIISLAEKYKKTSAQILLRWALQKNTVVIPKSSKKDRIIENAAIFDFEILEDDIKKIDGLSNQ